MMQDRLGPLFGARGKPAWHIRPLARPPSNTTKSLSATPRPAKSRSSERVATIRLSLRRAGAGGNSP
jgi:hypothetical protein